MCGLNLEWQAHVIGQEGRYFLEFHKSNATADKVNQMELFRKYPSHNCENLLSHLQIAFLCPYG